jgi:hypothetical protein
VLPYPPPPPPAAANAPAAGIADIESCFLLIVGDEGADEAGENTPTPESFKFVSPSEVKYSRGCSRLPSGESVDPGGKSPGDASILSNGLSPGENMPMLDEEDSGRPSGNDIPGPVDLRRAGVSGEVVVMTGNVLFLPVAAAASSPSPAAPFTIAPSSVVEALVFSITPRVLAIAYEAMSYRIENTARLQQPRQRFACQGNMKSVDLP